MTSDKNEVMLDLETASTESDAAIIAIGAVAFNAEEGIVAKFYWEVKLESAVEHGGTISASTFMWWLQQSEEARKAFAHNEDAEEVITALTYFTNWYNEYNCGNVWGNGPVTDNVILGNTYKRLKIPAPWTYKQDRCYRTIRELNPDIKVERIGIYHNAMNDAQTQAMHLLKIFDEGRIQL